MKLYTTYVSLTIAILVVVVSCAKIENNLTPAIISNFHGEGSTEKASSNFHGNYLIQQNYVDCQQCHGGDFAGGLTDLNCSTSDCHPSINIHKEGVVTGASPNFHGKFLQQNNWNLVDCMNCHGNNYSGGTSSPGCNIEGCHTADEGPEACNTCHGDFGNEDNIAPPNGLLGENETSDPAVGAHDIHLNEVSISTNIPCEECHIVPQTTFDDGHIDDTEGAEVVFGLFSNNGLTTPIYTNENSCDNTYCHGNFIFIKDSASVQAQFAYLADSIKGNNFSPKWNQVDGTQAECGTCHSLPPVGHIPADLSACGNCHTGIVDASGNIIDTEKHINGQANAFGN